jgi:hypothetical protein
MPAKSPAVTQPKVPAQAPPAEPARAGIQEQLSHADRWARGKDARALAPLESHAEFTPDKSRDRDRARRAA